jgi:hypothetical protein
MLLRMAGKSNLSRRQSEHVARWPDPVDLVRLLWLPIDCFPSTFIVGTTKAILMQNQISRENECGLILAMVYVA